MLPTVNFCGIEMTKMLIGANPFGGFSHQNKERDEQMRNYHTPERIIETWNRAWKAGINAFVTNNETKHVIDTTKQYLKSPECKLKWVGQLSCRSLPSMEWAIDDAVAAGCVAFFFHGGLMDELYKNQDEAQFKAWVEYGKSKGVPVGAAGHDVATHRWMDSFDILDFHVVPFFNCGSVHSKLGGERFQLEDPPKAVEFIQSVKKPCIAYKILGAGRLDATMAFDYALRNIKPGDVVNVGMNRADNDNIVEEDVAIVERMLK